MDKALLIGILASLAWHKSTVGFENLKKNTLAIGLTGGIASGKSAVSSAFADLGCEIVDADIVAREVVEPNTPGLKELIATFGKEIINPDKSLNRKKLRKIVFNNSEKLAKINAILHPLINSSIENKIKNSKESLVIVVIPLLCTGHNYKWLDRIIVVDVKVETQMQRLLARDNINQELAQKMINSQCSRNERLKLADDVINNEQSLQSLHQRVKVLHSLYKSMEN